MIAAFWITAGLAADGRKGIKADVFGPISQCRLYDPNVRIDLLPNGH